MYFFSNDKHLLVCAVSGCRRKCGWYSYLWQLDSSLPPFRSTLFLFLRRTLNSGETLFLFQFWRIIFSCAFLILAIIVKWVLWRVKLYWYKRVLNSSSKRSSSIATTPLPSDSSLGLWVVTKHSLVWQQLLLLNDDWNCMKKCILRWEQVNKRT